MKISKPLKIVMVLTAIFAGWVLIAPSIQGWLVVEKPLDDPDVIYVFSGSAVFRERVTKAAQVYQRTPDAVVVLSDDGGKAGWSNELETNPRFVDLAKSLLIAGKVPADKIVVLDSRVDGTAEEASALARFVKDRDLSRVLLVTSDYHSRRALNSVNSQIGERGIVVGIVSPPETKGSSQRWMWWLSPKGWKNVGGEYLKTLIYSLFY